MRVDFYQLARDPVPVALPAIARAVKRSGEKLLVVCEDEELQQAISRNLWKLFPGDFLAHGTAEEPHAERQPLLLSRTCAPVNGARFIALADGQWRDEALSFDRAFLFFDASTLDGARACWRMLGDHETVERRFWKQEDGRWVEGP